MFLAVELHSLGAMEEVRLLIVYVHYENGLL